MSLITQPISKQLFEFIRLRILEILVSEFQGQFLLTGDYELEVKIFIERSTPLDKTELDAIVISFAHGAYSNKNQGSVDGMYQFHIDCFTSEKSSNGVSGDTAAMIKLHKIVGLVRSILEDPIYKTLGVQPPIIMKSFISEINIAASNKEDALNTSMARLVFNVSANETNKLIIPPLIAGYTTSIKINGTGRGYFYEGINY